MGRRGGRSAGTTAVVLIVCVSSASCSSRSRVVLDLPPTTAAERALLVEIAGPERSEIHAIPLEGGAVDTSRIESNLEQRDDQPIVVTALGFEQTLADLIIAPGTVTPIAAGSGRALPMWRSAWTRSIHGGVAAAAWAATAAPSPTLLAIEIPRPVSPCPRFRTTQLEIDDPNEAAFAYRIDAFRALIANQIGQLAMVTIEQGSASLRLIGQLPFAPIGATWDRAGEIWAGSRSGELHRVTVASGATLPVVTSTRVAVSPRGGALTMLAIDRTAAGDPIVYTFSREGSIERFDGREWTLLHRFDNLRTTRNIGIARAGPGEIVAAAAAHEVVARIEDGRVTLEPVEAAGDPTGVAFIPGYGVLVATSRGEVLTSENDTWRPNLGDSMMDVYLYSFGKYGDGFVMGGAFGNIGQHIQGFGFCPIQMPAAAAIRLITTLGERDEHLVLLGEDVAGFTPVTIATPL